MTQDEAWLKKYKEVVDFINANKRNPSRYDDTERGLYVNWLKHNKKLLHAGQLNPKRVELFEKQHMVHGSWFMVNGSRLKTRENYNLDAKIYNKCIILPL